MKKKYNLLIIVFVVLNGVLGCKKLVEPKPPVSSIVTSEVFADSTGANSAILGIYYQMINTNGNPQFASGEITFFPGVSSDELIPYNTASADINGLYLNNELATNSIVSQLWTRAYSYIFQANSCIEGLNASTTIPSNTKNQLLGEATFLRDFCYFYLTNLYGDVPYVTSASNWQKTATEPRTPKAQIYQQLVSDLKNCQTWLRSDFSISNNERTRANKGAATALLSRIYLYQGDYKDAIATASSIISNNQYALASDLNNTFSPNSTEAILQFQINTSIYPWATTEGYTILPPYVGGPPGYYCSQQLMNAFEPGDKRKAVWIDTTSYSGTLYYFPNKYIVGSQNASINSPPAQYYMVFRVAEQYLIRAEAEAQLGDLSNALSDLNVIRNRAGLNNSTASGGVNILNAIFKERQVEFFAEWAHRWFDLIRANNINPVMSVVNPAKQGGATWIPSHQLYPIPLSELQSDPRITQNPSY